MPKKINSYQPSTAPPIKSADRAADQAFYSSKRWKDFRHIKLNQDPLCETCGSGKFAQVHHIIDRKEKPELSYVIENAKTLCRSCHSKVTRNNQINKNKS